jgi:hypothetical protein
MIETAHDYLNSGGVKMNEQYSISGRINILRQALASDKNKVAFFLGAGCPLSILDKDNKPLIPDIAGLTKMACDGLDCNHRFNSIPI